MSDDFPTHAEIGEENVREYLRRTGGNLRDEDKKGCFGAYNYHGCVLPCVWSDRCRQSQEDY
jgi:hypothetical protein